MKSSDSSNQQKLNEEKSHNEAKNQEKTSPWDIIKAHKSQLFFFVLGIMAIPLTISVFKEFKDVRKWMIESFPEPKYGWPQFSDFYITIVGCAVSWALQSILNKYTWQFFYDNCKEKENETIRLAKTQKSCDHFYKGIYFIIATVWGYIVMKDSNFLPPSLLGNGDIRRAYENYPLVVWPKGLKGYYLGTMGYHLHMLLHLLMDHVRHDYMEMMLHHIVTLFLYGFSFMMNMTLAGATVMYLHDIADIFTQIVRCWCETTYSTVTLFSALGMTATWFYTRILILPYIIYACWIQQPDIFHGMGFFTLNFLNIHLCILFVLHVYWFGLLIKIISKFAMGGKLQEPSDPQVQQKEEVSKKNI